MSSLQSNTMDKICGLCNQDPSKYCCPRCGVFYCSLSCYKSEKHSGCSESFYRECVNQEFASNQVDEESKNKMIDILKRIHNENFDNDDNDEENIEEIENDSDDDCETDFLERVENLNLDDPDLLWNALTDDEKNDFEAMLSQNDIETLIPQWQPWWLYRKEKKLVEDVNDVNGEKEVLERCPAIKTVPKFTLLTSIQPSPSISFNMANIIAGYAFVTRYVNGEIDPIETCAYILEVCNNLKKNENFENLELAVQSVGQMCIDSQYIDTDFASINVMKNDTVLILQGPSEEDYLLYRKAAISHLLDIFTKAKTQIKKSKPEDYKNKGEFSRKFPPQNRIILTDVHVAMVKKVIKKLEYYLSYLDSWDNKSTE